ncbi:MAG: 30S ribosomal protein S20 [Flavobacteriales bacterium]|jgi:small subunit ribosomal protein S20|nr:30S ribosomal protein S20 [Bacteroidota bacterium]MDG1158042.1 30S ribosomal protein S20 [Flavobacteriales bacterium]MDG1767576.1 30S ribosomal protein S20 [Flavobacteriales bacterium]MDP4587108.1 30S ribosomal protein S20 [Flavobacteriales bacterium]MDP4952708.1 30S ribosomal protein S20 [Flavobacteriales bacterium]
MANHKSALKRIRSNEKRKVRNRYQHKTTRNAVRVLRSTEDKKEASEMLPKVCSMLDKLAKRNIIHKNKAANLKSSLTLLVKAL